MASATSKRMQSYVNQKRHLRWQRARDAEERRKCDLVWMANEHRPLDVPSLIAELWPSMVKRTQPKRIIRPGKRGAR